MVKFLGNKKIQVAVFISGTGSNLKSLINYSLKNNNKIKIKVIISDNNKAKGLDFAKVHKIKKKIYQFKKKKVAEKKLLQFLREENIKLICLAGFMQILSANFIKKFEGQIINIHPSLLPKYKGLNTHERIIKNKEKFSGCTVHHVTSELDSGKIILQKRVKVLKSDTPKKLANRILKQEHILYPKALKKVCSSF
tara:strand:+ start:124 stop:708 length:585 start_codon:yes stop_codon:yes gene_type:complete